MSKSTNHQETRRHKAIKVEKLEIPHYHPKQHMCNQ
jgi:hypothetical protein